MSRLLPLLTFALLLRPLPAAEPVKVLTVITHGLQGGSRAPAWMQDMADAIADRACDGVEQDFLLYDWAVLSNKAGVANSDEVAGALADQIVARVGEHTRINLHLIGHSRGGFVVLDVARRLGNRLEFLARLDSFQLTTLDPVPFDKGTDYDVTISNLYELLLYKGFRTLVLPKCVTRGDNYYQTTEDYFSGHTVLGSFSVGLNLELFSWKARQLNHEEVHDWYHWTIDKTDGDDHYVDVPGTNGLRSWLYRKPSAIDIDGDRRPDGWGYDISVAARACAG